MNTRFISAWVVCLAVGGVFWAASPGFAQDVAPAADSGAAPDKAAPAPADAPDWASLSPGDLAGLAREMSGDDAQLKAARQAIADFVTKTYLKDAVAAKTVAVGDWRALVESLGGDLSLADRAAWLDRIVGAYAGNAEAVRGLKADELRNVGGTVKVLGATWQTQNALVARIREAFDANAVGAMKYDDVRGVCDTLNDLGARPSNDLVKAYVDKSQEWQSFDVGKLADVAGRLDGLGPSAGKQQTALAKCVMAAYLGSVEAVKAVGLETWQSLARMGQRLPEKDRKAWASALEAAFAPDEASLLQCGPPDMARLVGALQPLDRAEAGRLAYTWFTKSDLKGQGTVGDLRAIVEKAVLCPTLSGPDREKALTALETVFASRSDASQERDQIIHMVWLWGALHNPSKVGIWAQKMYQFYLGSETSRDAATMDQLNEVAVWMHEGGLIANGKAFPAFATALARLARDGAVETEYPWWPGAMLATPELRQAVRDQLVDAEGLPRLGVAKVLASAYGCYGETKAWCDFLEATIAKTQDDTKAMWLLARAYSESASMPEPDPLAGRKWFDQALAAAKSDGLRFRVVQDLVRGEMTCRQYKIASSLLESVAGQFASTQGAAIDALRQAIVQGDYECRLAREQYFAASRAESRAAWEGEIQRRVEEGKQNGRPEEADRYSKMLSDQPAVPPERPPVAPGQGI